MKNLFRFRYHFISVAICFFALTAAAQAGFGAYDMREVENSDLSPFKKWTKVVGRSEEQFEVSDDECGETTYHPCIVKEWKTFLDTLKDASLEDQLSAINDWGNAHPYIVDQLNWSMNDFWETPYEFMTINGDCEDYAIAKYYSLKRIGVDTDKMRITIVQDNNLGGIIHAVLTVRDGRDVWVLDNQIKELSHASAIYHYRPIYSLNEDHWWRYIPN